MVNRSQLFRTAWTQARIMARCYGGTAKARFAACLRGAWKQAKAALVMLTPPAGISPHIAALVVRQRIAPPKWRFANAIGR